MAGGEAHRGFDQHVLDLGRFLLGAEVSASHLSWPERMRLRSCQGSLLSLSLASSVIISVHRYEIVLRYRRALVQRHLDGSPLHPELELQLEETEHQLEELEEDDETACFKTGFMEKRGQVVFDARVACSALSGYEQFTSSVDTRKALMHCIIRDGRLIVHGKSGILR